MSNLLKEAYEFIRELVVGESSDRKDTILDEKQEEIEKTSQIKEEADVMNEENGVKAPAKEDDVVGPIEQEEGVGGAEDQPSELAGEDNPMSSEESPAEGEEAEGGDVVDRLEATLREFFEAEMSAGTSPEELAKAIDELASKIEEGGLEGEAEESEEAESEMDEEKMAGPPPWLQSSELDEELKEDEEGAVEAEAPESEEEAEEVAEEALEEEAEEESEDEEEGEKESEEEESEDEEEGEKESEEEESEDEEGEEKKSGLILRETEKYAAVLYNSADSSPEKLEWVVFDKTSSAPVMRVLAKEAFGDKLYSTPAPEDYPNHKFASYGEAFISEAYGDALLSAVESYGLDKACEAASGRIVKSAQIGVSPTTGGPTAMQERQPVGSTTPTSPLGSGQEVSEGGQDVNLNPTQMGPADQEPSPVTVIDFMLGFLPYLVASGVYTPGEIVQELKDTFTDDDASARFIGALSEKAKSVKESLGVSEGENAPFDPGMLMGGAQPPQTGIQTEMPGAKMSELQAEVEQLREKVASYEKEAVLRAKVSSAVAFIRNEMQRRGANGKPLMPSVDYLVMTGMPKDAAIKEERELTYKKAEELVALDDLAWKALQDTVMQVPYLQDSGMEHISEASQGVEKVAHTLPIFMANDNSVNFDGFDESIFESKLTQLAREHNAKRASKRARI